MRTALTDWELVLADQTAGERHRTRLGRSRRSGFEERGEEHRRKGARAEVAAAKALGRYWRASVFPDHDEGDLAGGIEVRYRRRADFCLPVYPEEVELDGRAFLMVTGGPRDFELVGWVDARDLDDGWTTPVGYVPPSFEPIPGALYVPPSDLRSPALLEAR
jgi:hypothetical protein